MKNNSIIAFIGIATFFAIACGGSGEEEKKQANAGEADTVATKANETVDLPAPYATKSSTKVSNVIGWHGDKTPTAPAGFTVTKFADSLDNPRWIYVGPNGDVFVSEASTETNIVKQAKTIISGKATGGNISGSADKVLLFRDANHDGVPEMKTTFLTDLKQPFGMLILGNNFYVANTDGVMQFPYQAGQTKITSKGKKILNLPAGGYNNHW